MASKIEWNYFRQAMEDVASEACVDLAKTISECADSENYIAFFQWIFSSVDQNGIPTSAWKVVPSALLAGASPPFIDTYETVLEAWNNPRNVPTFWVKGKGKSLTPTVFNKVIEERYKALSPKSQKRFLMRSLRDYTDMNGIYNILRFCVVEQNPEGKKLCGTISSTYNITDYSLEISEKAKQAMRNRNTYIGHKTGVTASNTTIEMMCDALEPMYAVAARIPPENNPETIKPLKEIYDRAVTALQQPHLQYDEIEQSVTAESLPFAFGWFDKAPFIIHYDTKTKILYLHSIQEVIDYYRERQQEYERYAEELKKQMGITDTKTAPQEAQPAAQNAPAEKAASAEEVVPATEETVPAAEATAPAEANIPAEEAVPTAQEAQPAEEPAAEEVEEAPEEVPIAAEERGTPESVVLLPPLPPVRKATRTLQSFPLMQQYEKGTLSREQLTEIVQNCDVLADTSCWLSAAGRDLITQQVLPLQEGTRKAFIVDWATQVELYQLETAPETDPERQAQAHSARKIQHTLHHTFDKRHKKRWINYGKERAGIFSSQSSLMDALVRNPGYTLCLITADISFCQELAKRQYPNVMPLLVTPTGGATVHPALRELVRRNSMGHTVDGDDGEKADNLKLPRELEVAAEQTEASPASHEPTAPAVLTASDASAPEQPAPAPKKRFLPPLPSKAPCAAKKAEAPLASVPAVQPSAICIRETGELLPWQEARLGLLLKTGKGEPVCLGVRIAGGGEGDVYQTAIPGIVAKLYNKEHLTANRRDKLKLMTETPLEIPGVCWPTELLYYTTGDEGFAGFLMPRVDSGYMDLLVSVLQLIKPEVRKSVPNLNKWDRLALVRLAEEICRMVSKVNAAGILLGDINVRNILVRVSTPEKPSVMLVDCDSCQIGGYPCPVGTALHTSPDYLERYRGDTNFGNHLRTQDDENYALAVILFELLMLNQYPFGGKGNTEMLDAARNRRFSYRFKPKNSIAVANDGRETPDGPFRLIWNNMPYDIRESFYNAFALGQSISAAEWAQHFSEYASGIRRGTFTRELEPIRYFDPNGTYTKDFVCDCCGKKTNMPIDRWERNQKYRSLNLCCSCLSTWMRLREDPEQVELTCKGCGKTYLGTKCQSTLIEYDKGSELDRYCPDCQSYAETTCAGCHKKIEVRKYKTRRSSRLYCADCMQKVPAVCSQCGKTYDAFRYQAERAKRSPLFRLKCPNCLQNTASGDQRFRKG